MSDAIRRLRKVASKTYAASWLVWVKDVAELMTERDRLLNEINDLRKEVAKLKQAR